MLRPDVFCSWHILRSVEDSGRAAAEGRSAAQSIVLALEGRLPDRETAIPIKPGGNLRFVYPQYALPGGKEARLFARASRSHNGSLTVFVDGREISSRRISALPERRLTLRIPTDGLGSSKAYWKLRLRLRSPILIEEALFERAISPSGQAN